MIALLIALTLPGTEIPRSRVVEVDRPIEISLVRIGAGLLSTYGSEVRLDRVAQTLEGDLGHGARVLRPQLFIDGSREGLAIARVGRALWRLGRFMLDRSDPGESVEFRYRLLYRGFAIFRRVTIRQGSIHSTATVSFVHWEKVRRGRHWYWVKRGIGPDGRLQGATVCYTAKEQRHDKTLWEVIRGGNRTTYRLSATVDVNTGICPDRSSPRLRIVANSRPHRDAIRNVGREIDGALATAVGTVRGLSDRGHLVIVDEIVGRAANFR